MKPLLVCEERTKICAKVVQSKWKGHQMVWERSGNTEKSQWEGNSAHARANLKHLICKLALRKNVLQCDIYALLRKRWPFIMGL